MRTKVAQVFPETALERILDALERELIEASDAEILEAAGNLGMKPHMKGSAAFLGLRYPMAIRAADFFGGRWMLQQLSDPRRLYLASVAPSKQPEPPGVLPPHGSSRPRPARGKTPRPPKEPGRS